MNRRGFVARAVAALACLGFTKSVDAQPAPELTREFVWESWPRGTLTGRICQTLGHREALGLENGCICVSPAGFDLIRSEHHPEPVATIAGVPLVLNAQITAERDYWVLEPSGRNGTIVSD